MVGGIFFSSFSAVFLGVRRRSVVQCQKQGCNERRRAGEGDPGRKIQAKAFVT